MLCGLCLGEIGGGQCDFLYCRRVQKIRQQQNDKKGLQRKQSCKERMLPEHLCEGTPAHDGSVLFVGAPVVHSL